MSYNDNLIFIIFGVIILIETIIFIAFRKTINKSNITKYGLGYGICVGLSLVVLVVTVLMPLFWGAFFCIIFVPFMFFSFMLNKKVINSSRFKNTFVNVVYKVICTFLIWFIAFFPLSLIGIFWALDTPVRYERSQEIKYQKEQILEYETYADLTEFGLGIYKLGNKGDEHLWDITKPKDYIGKDDDGTYWIYDYGINRKDDECWDDWYEHSNEGKNVTYDVVFYDETYIIIPPMWDKTGTGYRWNVIFLCKDINPEEDLFEIGILEPEVVDRLLELPSEQYTRKEISEMLGKDF